MVRRMLSVLADGASVFALIDVPLRGAGHGFPVKFLGQSARFPSGLARMAFEKEIPMVTVERAYTSPIWYSSAE